MTKIEPSSKGTLNKIDYKKILKGAGIAFGGAFAFSMATWLMGWLGTGSVDWSKFTQPFLTTCIPAALSVGINALVKFFQGPSQ